MALAHKLQMRIAELDFSPDDEDAAMKAAYLEDVLTRLLSGQISEVEAREYLNAGAAHFGRRRQILDAEEDSPAPHFPLAIYPKWMQAYCIELAEACEVPQSVSGFTLLGMLGAAYGTHLQLAFKSGYVRYCHDYFFLVADVSVGKSGVFSYLSKPLYEIQRTLRAHTRPADGEGSTPPLPQVVISDCTPEAMVDIQNANGGAIAHITPDTPLFAQLSAIGQKPWPLAPYCSSHTGEPYHVHRITRGSNEVECARLAVVAATQPDTLKQVHSRPQIETSGFLARCTFYVVPPLTADDLSPGDPSVSGHLQARYTEVVKSLGLFYRNAEHAPCRFDRTAALARIEWVDSMRPRYKLPQGDLHAHAGHCAKLEEKVGRWAALLHVLHHADAGTGAGLLSVEDWERALSIYDFAFAHHERALAIVHQGPVASLTDALEAFCRRHRGKTVTERLIKKNCRVYERSSQKTREDAIAAIEAKGLGRWLRNTNPGGRPSPGLKVV